MTMAGNSAGGSKARRWRFHFSIANLLGFVALAAASLATFTNHDPLDDLLVLGATTVVLAVCASLTWFRRDGSSIGTVGAMVVYYALTRFVWYRAGHGPPMLPYSLMPAVAVSVGVVVAVVFLLSVRSRSYFVAIILLACVLCLGTVNGSTLHFTRMLITITGHSVVWSRQ
jgi:hypothetical protein